MKVKNTTHMSKLIYFDFRCHNGHKMTLFVKSDVKVATCGCGAPARRILSAAKIDCGGGRDPDFPTAYDAWEKRQRGKVQDEKKWLTETGEDRFYGGDTQQSDALPNYAQSSTNVTREMEE